MQQSFPRASGPVSPTLRRLIAGGLATGCGAVLGVALLMTPSEAGLGTHEQLNLPSCGWISLMDVPCVTCGMTTAFSHAVRGELLQSLLVQPFGFLLAMATAMTLLIALHVMITGSNVTMMFARLWRPRSLWLLGLLLIAAWAYKIATYKGLLA